MTNYISIKQILDDILDHPLLKDITFERAINYAITFIRIIGCPNIFIEKSEIIDIEEYRGKLPCDINTIIQVRRLCPNNRYEVFRHTTDSFHLSNNKSYSEDLTYKVQGGVIFTSMKEGTIEVIYNAIPVDNEGFPFIPDNSSFIRALELYIKKCVFTTKFDLGEINISVYNNTCQEYAFAVGQAQSELVKPTLDQMEALANSLTNLVPRVSEHRSGFVNNGTKEILRIQ